MKKWVIKKSKKILRYAARNHKRYWMPVLAALIVVVYMDTFSKPDTYIPDIKAYKPLLDTIAKGESKGNYNAYYGNAGNSDIKFTEMSVREVLNWQKHHVEEGSPSSAVGKYQIIRPTLTRLVTNLNINPDDKFNENMQDRMAVALLEKRGSIEYANDKLSREEFAANIAKEWAALPKVKGSNPHESYYAGDGLNKARLSIDEIYSALNLLKS